MSRRLPTWQYVENWQVFVHDDYIEMLMEQGYTKSRAGLCWDHALRTFPMEYKSINEHGKMELWVCVSFGYQWVGPTAEKSSLQEETRASFSAFELSEATTNITNIAEYGGGEEG